MVSIDYAAVYDVAKFQSFDLIIFGSKGSVICTANPLYYFISCY